jgi:phosphoenolpyruvate carboxykinase (ATP)
MPTDATSTTTTPSATSSRLRTMPGPTRPTRSGAAGRVHRNPSPAVLVEQAVARGEGVLTAGGALCVETGAHTGRSPRDKFVAAGEPTDREIWWGEVNQPISAVAFAQLQSDVLEHLSEREHWQIDATACADPDVALPVRVLTEHAWTALFARHLLRPAERGGGSRLTILHAPTMQADPARHETRSGTAIALSLEQRLVVIAGTAYAGEIKKAVFTALQAWLPAAGIATMHCAANVGAAGDVALFFGLSGTGKTTLSADGERRLIGDDEHGWSDRGVFTFEGGCYAKTIGLSAAAEPQIHRACNRFGTVLENVVLDPLSREPRYDDGSLTENTRAAFPLAALDGAHPAGVGGHPRNVLFLTADAFGVLPPVARLTAEQALFWFLTGYTSKLAGTERGVSSPSATFSACFGAPFLPLPPTRYARLLGERLERHAPDVWLVNTGWTGGPPGVGRRMPIDLTRAVVRAIHDGRLAAVESDADPRFGFAVPRRLPGIDGVSTSPRDAWPDGAAFDRAAAGLARDIADNFRRFAEAVPPSVAGSGPRA